MGLTLRTAAVVLRLGVQDFLDSMHKVFQFDLAKEVHFWGDSVACQSCMKSWVSSSSLTKEKTQFFVLISYVLIITISIINPKGRKS